MKTILWFSLTTLFLGTNGFAQNIIQQDSSKPVVQSKTIDTLIATTDGDAAVRAVIFKEMKKEHEENNQEIKKQLDDFEKIISDLDQKLAKESDNKKKVEGLITRVQVLEKKETAVSDNVLYVFQSNYQAAVVNLMFMERELKPLELFNSSKDFFSSLSASANPMNYSGFSDWFNDYKAYVNKNRATEAKLMVVDKFMGLAGNFSKGTPLAGPLTSILVDGVSLFMNSMKKNDPKRKASMEMVELIALLSQFGHDMLAIENEWDAINKELEELQRQQNECLEANFKILGIDKKDFQVHFTREMDANKRIEYIQEIKNVIKDKVKKEREVNSEKWKTIFHNEMQTVQNLKLRFGNLTLRIKKNIEGYKELINKYSQMDNAEIATKMKSLDEKLTRLNSAFEATFSPQHYIESATKMYIVD